ncbi:MAG: hypothetical protein QM733_24565 [Ilumatobacteraceae bacterium]
MKKYTVALLLSLVAGWLAGRAQTDLGNTTNLTVLPSKFLTQTLARTSILEDQIDRETKRFLKKMAQKENRMLKRIHGADSAGAASLFAGVPEHYQALSQKISADTPSGNPSSLTGTYRPYADSLQCMLQYLQANPALVRNAPALQGSLQALKALQLKMQTADNVRNYVAGRKQFIAQYIQQHTGLPGAMGTQLQEMNKGLYYYSQQVAGYKDMLNDPDKLTRQALAILQKLPAFQSFVRQNGQLAGLFGIPGNYAATAGLTGLQTKDQVSALIQQQISAAGSGGQAALQANLQSASSQLSRYKDKLAQLGTGGTDLDLKDFRPNDQKTKTFWRRLEYGVNFQTTRDNYYFPTTTDFGLSAGYRFSDGVVAGVGASYKLGWGNGIQHISFSSQGCGLRSFLDVRLKRSFSITGGFEYNYTTPFSGYQQLRHWDDWSKSGLIGLSKTVSLKSRVFQKTKVQLLWDFLSYQQVPKTQPVLFRLGYDF